jgi:tRNA pseudouridine55 synthase
MSACGFLFLDKPSGVTSQKALSPLKRALSEKRIGHAGTLDPLATGLLVVAAGKATRLMAWAEGMDKEYLVSVRTGIRTDTLDMDGRILSETEPFTGMPDWRKLSAPFLGAIDQVPPAYSAISVDGVRSYARARAGEEVLLPPRRVRIDSIEPVDGSPLVGTGWLAGDFTLRVKCSKGTYVRSLVRDLGEEMGCGATVSALRRTAIGDWRLPDSFGASEGIPEVHPVASVFPGHPHFVADADARKALSHGHATLCGLADADDVFCLNEQGLAIAFGKVASGRFQPDAMLVDPAELST